MESWQKEHIQKNLVQLINNTSCDSHLLAELFSENVLSHREAEEILEYRTQSEKCRKLYEILLTRVGSYDILVQALERTSRSGARKILIEHSAVSRSYGRITYDQNHILGRGSSGTKVFKGTLDGRDAAVKVVNTRNMSTEYTLHEVNILKMLDHPNIVRYLFSEDREFLLYIALEYCDISLQDAVNQNLLNMKPTDVLEQCTKGLIFVHQQNIIHLNIKPSSILLKYNNQVKLCNFIKSKKIPQGMTSVSVEYKAHAHEDWTAPELFELHRPYKDKRKSINLKKSADIFSLGCIFFFVLTNGSHPFGHAISRRYNVLEDKPQLEGSNIDSKWMDLIMKMISHQESERPSCDHILTSESFDSGAQKTHDPLTDTGFSKNDKIEFFFDKKLGSGCQGTNVHPGKLGTLDVAVKAIYQEHMKLVETEFDTLKHCLHQNILRCYRKDQDRNRILLALELCQASLQKWITSPTCISPAKIETRELLLQVSTGIAYLHSKKILHQDLKPPNILLAVAGNTVIVKIADFGISKFLKDESTSVTMTSIVGTERWQAPEVLKFIDEHENKDNDGKRVKIKMSRKSDVFSLGLVFFAVITKGKHPFGPTTSKIRANIENDNPEFIEIDVPLEFYDLVPLIRDMVSFNPVERPSIDLVKMHPIFWKVDKSLAFLLVVWRLLSREEAELFQSHQQCIQQLKDRYQSKICSDSNDGWLASFSSNGGEIYQFLKSKSNNTNSVVGLLETIYNVETSYYQNVPKNIRDMVKNSLDFFSTYWLAKFPSLMHHVWMSFKDSKAKSLKKYYPN